ncbi:LOW QUALITY PROTEIN: hypothetical protein HID58_060545, partial [Brassica napus]
SITNLVNRLAVTKYEINGALDSAAVEEVSAISIPQASGGRRRVSTRRLPPLSPVFPAFPFSSYYSAPSSLLHLLCSSSGCGRIRRPKSEYVAVYSFPGVMARSWLDLRRRRHLDGRFRIWVRSLSECPPEWCSVAAFAVLVCSLLPLSSPGLPAPPLSSFRRKIATYFTCTSSAGFSVSVWIPRGRSDIFLRLQLNFTRSDGQTRTCRPCFACPSVEVALGMVCGPSDRSPVVFSYEQYDFEAGPGLTKNTLVSC